jgi:hypothetical protein
MDPTPDLPPGFVRIGVRLPRGETYTPGDLARLTGVPGDQLGPVTVLEREALVDVRAESGKEARERLEKLGPTRLVGWQWQWLRLAIGRNHGLSMGQLRKIMLAADAMPLGRIAINNTHSLVGVQDFKLPGVIDRLGKKKINGFNARAEAIPPGKGPGDPSFSPTQGQRR